MILHYLCTTGQTNNQNICKKMKKIRAAVVGYGNIGKFVVEALEAAPDFEIAGTVRRHGAENKPAELAQYDVVKDITELKDVDVAILATPTRSCEEYATKILPLGINTVDSFDIHTSIAQYRQNLNDALQAARPRGGNSRRVGTPGLTASCAPSWRASRPKASATPTSAPA